MQATTWKLTRLLSEEHRLIQRALVLMARYCANLRQGGPGHVEAVADLLRFIREFADQHHHSKEEDVLFPWMVAHGFSAESGPLGVMLYEHSEARHHVHELSEALATLTRANDDAPARKRMIAHGEQYAVLLWAHIWKEDNILYPMAEQIGPEPPEFRDAASDARQHSVDAEFRGIVERLEDTAAGWPKEQVYWPTGCH